MFYFDKCEEREIHEKEWEREVRRSVWMEGRRAYKDAGIEAGGKNRSSGRNKRSGKIFQSYYDEDFIVT